MLNFDLPLQVCLLHVCPFPCPVTQACRRI